MDNKCRQIARLKNKCISNRKIAESLGLSRNYVNLIVKKMITTKRTFQEIEAMNDMQTQSLLDFEEHQREILHMSCLTMKNLQRSYLNLELLCSFYGKNTEIVVN